MEMSREVRSVWDEENAEQFQSELREPGKASALEGKDWPHPAELSASRRAHRRKGVLIFWKHSFLLERGG